MKACLLFIAPVAVLAAGTQVAYVRPWLDPTMDSESRLQLFLEELNETQIYAMVQGDTVLDDNGTGVNACIGHISGNDTLGIPGICMGDGPAGVGNSMNNVTTFPAPVMASSSWNTTLEYVYGQALAQEHMAKGKNVVLSPTINILRSPAWGRAAETFSEDTYLTSRIAVAQILGIQSQNALACPKHFAGYNQETNRFGLDPEWHAVDAVVDKRTLHEVYLPAFKAAVQEAKAASVMCSYNQLNGHYTCENEWLLNTTLKHDWGFTGFVVADWYFAQRTTVQAANNGLDISMPGGSLEDSYGFPAYYGDLLVDAVENGSVEWERVRDMVARLWRPMFEVGAIDNPVTGDATAVARSQEHLDVAQSIAEEGMVLLQNHGQLLPLARHKYSKIAVYGRGATNKTHVTELHGGFVIDSTLSTEAPFDYLSKRGESEGIEFKYAEAFPGTDAYGTAPSAMFKNLTATYWTTTDFSGAINQTDSLHNITAASFPTALWQSWPDVFSVKYQGIFLPNTTGVYHFSLYGQGDANLTLGGQSVVTMTKQNFGNPVFGSISLVAHVPVELRLDYSMGYSLSTGAYGVTLGVDVANQTREAEMIALSRWADLSIVVVNDCWSEGADNNLGLRLPAGQDEIISQIASASSKTLVLLGTNSAVLMPWINEVEGVVEMWYPGQQIGSALERVLYGDISPSGKLPLTFPKTLEDSVVITESLESNFTEGLYVGYKWHDQQNIEPLFPFGFGLTYTEFALENFAVKALFWASSDTPVYRCQSTLSNVGKVKAKQVVQLYVSFPGRALEPPKLLKGFIKVELAAGDTAQVAIDVKKSDLQVWDEQIEDWALVEGEYEFMVGFSSREILATQKLFIC